MKCEEGGDLGGGRGDSEVRWVIVCEAGDIVCEVGVRKLDGLDGVKDED